MIKAWLLIFIFNVKTGDFLVKRELPLSSMKLCQQLQETIKSDRAKQLNLTERYEMVCVSGDHYSGRKFDTDTPLDLDH
jgi:hypothetical protein